MVKLRRLLIHKHRIVKPGTTLVFNDGYNVLLGKNGTGKTTLLNLIAMCLSCSFAGLEEEEFSLEYELELPLGRLQIQVSHLQRQSPSRRRLAFARSYESEIALELIASTTESQSFKAVLKNGRMTVDGSNEFVPDFTIDLFDPKGFMVFIALSCLAKTWITQSASFKATLHGLIEHLYAAYSRFDEGLEWLKDVLGNARIHFLGGDLATALVMEEYRIPLELGSAFRGRAEVASAVDPSKPFVEFSHSDLAFLGHAVAALNYSGATLTLELKSMERSSEGRDTDESTFGALKLGFTKRSGQYLQIDRLSFGEKRLIGLFYYLALSPSILIADELANGLHHEMIARCLEAAGERQKFLATQNPLLLDHVPLQSPEEVRRTFIRCQLQSEGPREQMVWSGLSEDEAAAFYKDYEVGIQHTNDILRLRGLW